MTVVFSDTFTDTDGTTLASHTPTVGTSWSVVDYTVSGAYTAEINTNRLRAISPGYGSFYRWRANPATAFAANHTISFTYGANIGAIGRCEIRVETRKQGDGSHYAFVLDYSWGISDTDVAASILYVAAGGAETVIASGTFSPSAFAADAIVCGLSGSTLTMTRNGGALLSGSNGTIAAAGNLELKFEVNSFGDAARLDTLSVDNVAVASHLRRNRVVSLPYNRRRAKSAPASGRFFSGATLVIGAPVLPPDYYDPRTFAPTRGPAVTLAPRIGAPVRFAPTFLS